MMRLRLDRPWLEADLGAPHRVLSWAVNRPGLVTARRILWREVRDEDLTPELDVPRWLSAELAARGAQDAVTMLTSRDIAAHHLARARAGGVEAAALATVGLSNAERVGTRIDRGAAAWGTINIAVQVSAGLTEAALVEALSIAAQARTAAMIAAGPDLPDGRATGTGTDCIALAAPAGEVCHAGLHTDLGEALGRAVFDVVTVGVAEWMATVGARRACRA